MSPFPSETELAALRPFCQGKTLELGAGGAGVLPGTVLIDRDNPSQCYESLPSCDEASVDAIVSAFGFGHSADPIRCLREWRRVLRDGGQVALLLPDAQEPAGQGNRYTPVFVSQLFALAGGYQVAECREVVPNRSWLIRAVRGTVPEVRMPLGSVGGGAADAATRSPEARAELYFQIGTMLLRAGDPTLAEACFRAVLGLEPDNAEACFGLGMAHAARQEWGLALTELQRALALDPRIVEVQRWIGLARQNLAANPTPNPASRATVQPAVSAGSPKTESRALRQPTAGLRVT
ncbi:MAG: tetratricopeptide repeat protein [Planctomycetes bacterium]|nr:tetratricopeptide repeat protein [Planctomycetota bacterium]